MNQGTSSSEATILSYTYLPGTKPLTLIWIHGLNRTKEDFRGIANYPNLTLYNNLVIDLPGHGGSVAPKNFSYKLYDQATIIKKQLEILKISTDLVLILHSMGGPIGVMLAEMLFGRVKGILYTEGNLDYGDCFLSGEITKNSFDDYLKIFNQEEEDYLKKNPTRSKRRGGTPEANYYSSVDLVEISKKDELFQRLKSLNIPILAVYGEKNKGQWESEKRLAAVFPIHYVPNAGHNMMKDNPNDFYTSVSRFIDKL